jgi:hypothetical protein
LRWELASLAAIILGVARFLLVRRQGPESSNGTGLWRGFIAFLAAPVERDLQKRLNKALREDNERLMEENERLRHGRESNTQ